jgi:predicted esterase
MDPHAHLPIETAGAPLGDGRGVVIMLHGRGAGPHNILELVPLLALPSFTYLAPTAADHTWYPFGFMEPTERNEPKLSSALKRIDTLVEEVLAKGLGAERIVLMGFSQGACLAGEYAVRHSRRYGGVAMLSGGLIGPPGTTWHASGSFNGTPVFLGCSDRDAHIPKPRVDESAQVFERMGASVTEHIYPNMGHLVTAEEIAEVHAMLDAIH